MDRVLVTGATGHLGRELVPQLKKRGCHLRLLARKPGLAKGVEWAVGDLATGEGLLEAMQGIDGVVHAATFSPIAMRGSIGLQDFFSTPTEVDLDGTRRLLKASKQAQVKQFLFVSIVGLEHSRLPYAKMKLKAERLVRSSDVSWAVVRATGFYYLVEQLLAGMMRGPFSLLPATLCNAVATFDVADYLTECVREGVQGVQPEIGGPEVMPFSDYGRQLKAATGIRTKILSVPIPDRLGAMAGLVRSEEKLGRLRWRDWLGNPSPEPGHVPAADGVQQLERPAGQRGQNRSK